MTVLLRDITTASGHRFGHATLAAPDSLNALSLDMVDRLAPQLDAWLADPGVVGILLDAEGDKAFCAGGDVLALYRSMRETEPGAVPRAAASFFEREYRLDHRIHTSPKPILCWGHGIVMGGGLGLMAGASHRVATPATRVAMPEISIGLYPDVGGSWFLPRLPGRTGLFLALTGAPLNAADARFAGLADAVLPHAAKADVLLALAEADWQGEQAADSARLSRLLDRYVVDSDPSMLRRHFDLIETLIHPDDPLKTAEHLHALAACEDPWLAAAGKAFSRGSPTSAALAFALWRKARHLSLAEVFRLEYQLSLGCCMQADFAEGIRALLVDKDRKPQWQAVSPAAVEACFQAPHAGPHPLADLI